MTSDTLIVEGLPAMNFARRATIALITGILSIGTISVMASPADAARDTSWPQLRADTSWPQ